MAAPRSAAPPGARPHGQHRADPLPLRRRQLHRRRRQLLPAAGTHDAELGHPLRGLPSRAPHTRPARGGRQRRPRCRRPWIKFSAYNGYTMVRMSVRARCWPPMTPPQRRSRSVRASRWCRGRWPATAIRRVPTRSRSPPAPCASPPRTISTVPRSEPTPPDWWQPGQRPAGAAHHRGRQRRPVAEHDHGRLSPAPSIRPPSPAHATPTKFAAT